MASRADVQAGRAYVTIYVRDTLSKGLKAASTQLNNFGRQATALGQQLLRIGVISSTPFALSLKTFADFDDAMRAVGAVSGSTAEQLASMTARAKELGASTSFTAVQVGNLMGELGRAGFVAEEINVMTQAVLDLARATGTDATLASGIMAASIRQFGLGAGDATRVADALTVAANKSFNTVEQLGEALSYAGPVAADFNMSIEDTLAILGALGNVGIQASNAGTAVRRLLTLSGAEAGKMQEIFGVNALDAAGNMRPLVDILDEVNTATASLGTGERAAKFNEFFGLLGITGASAISKNITNVKELQAALLEANGTAAKTAAEMDAGLGGAFRILLSAVEGAAIAIGESLAEPVTAIAKSFQNWSNWIQKVAEKNKAFVQSIAAVAAGLVVAGAALIGVGSVLFMIGAAINGILAIGAAVGSIFAAILSPIGLTVAAVALLTVHLVRFTDAGQEAAAAVTGYFGKLWKDLDEGFGGVVSALKSGELGLAANIAAKAIQLVFQKMVEDLSSSVTESMRDTFGSIGTDIIKGDFTKAWETSIIGLTMLWDGMISGFTESIGLFVSDMKDEWQSAVQFISDKIFEIAELSPKIGSLILGVDLEEARAQKERMDAMLVDQGGVGSLTPSGKSFLDEAKEQADAELAAKGKSLEDRIMEIRREARAAADLMEAAFAERTAGGEETAASDAVKLQEELNKLLEEAKRLEEERTKAIAERDADAASGPGGGEGGLGVGAAASARSFGTFSAAVAAAQGGSQANSTPALLNRMLRAQESREERKRKIAENHLKRAEESRDSLRKMEALLSVA